jgi:hypothetical protein
MKNARLDLVLATAIVAAFVVGGSFSCVRGWVTNPHPVEATKAEYRRDSNDLSAGLTILLVKPTFRSTFSWWHEGILPTIPYWRPLACQFQWLESRSLGIYRFDRWMWVSLILELLLVMAYAVFVYALTRNYAVTLLSVVIWAGARSWLFLLRHVFQAADETPLYLLLRSVKFQPDLFANLLIFSALALLCSRKWIGALVCTAIAICFKESGWLALPLGVVILASRRQLQLVPKWMYIATIAMMAVLVLFRWSAGPAVVHGFHMGSNQFWYSRYANAVEGALSINSQVDPGEALFALSIYLLYRVKRLQRPLIGLGILATALIAGAAISAHQEHCSLLIGAVMILDPSVRLPVVLACLVCMVGLDAVVRDKDLRGFAVLSVALGLIAALQFVAATQILTHALVNALAFQSLFVACVSIAVVKRIAG